MSAFTYQFRDRATWGINVWLSARVSSTEAEPTCGIEVAKGFWLDTTRIKWAGEARPWLVAGIALVEAAIRQKVGRHNILIVVENIDVVLTDYQDEGLTAAIALWLAQEFGISPPQIQAHYDKGENKYIYEWSAAS